MGSDAISGDIRAGWITLEKSGADRVNAHLDIGKDIPPQDSMCGLMPNVGTRNLAGNPDSPQAGVFTTSTIVELVSVATYYVHYYAI